MSTIATKDGTRIHYKDWGSGRAVVFSHGWPLDADAWDTQMIFLVQNGYRVIAHDRRGHGRSGQPGSGNDMDTYADDLAALIEALDLWGTTLVGHSAGAGEVARYIGRHGTSRIVKAVLISAVPPIMLRTAQNPGGVPQAVFDEIRTGVAANRSQYYRDLAIPFYNFNRPNVKRSQGIVEAFWLQGMRGSIKSQFECIRQFSETNFTSDLKNFNVPTLILHGDDDQIVPIDTSARLTAKLVKKSILKVYPGAPHGLCTMWADALNGDLLAFLRS
jgi:non-heme chloroperoxidase